MDASWHGTVSRRRLITGAATAAGIAASEAALAKAPLLKTQAPAFYRYNVGTIEGTVVSDGPLSIGDPAKTFKGPTAEEVGLLREGGTLIGFIWPAQNPDLMQQLAARKVTVKATFHLGAPSA